MTAEKDRTEQHYRDAIASLRGTLAEIDRCSDGERSALTAELAEVGGVTEKLASGRVDIVVFGEISTGKSALINALAGSPVAHVGVEGGVTRAAGRVPWRTCTYSLEGHADSRVDLIDTPGLNEVDGAERARLAREQARRADLVLFVTDSDLNEIEWATLRELAHVHKPTLVVLNKADLYTPEQRARLRDVIAERVAEIVAPEDVVVVSADPMPREVIVQAHDGSERSELRRPKPDVEELMLRILAILDREGKALVALNGSLFATDLGDKLRSAKVRLRDAEAQKLILRFAALKGAAVALNPVPIADIAGGFAADATMVAALARVYGERISLRGAGRLASRIALSVGWVTLAEWLAHAAAGLVKGFTLGAGIVVTSLPQGIAASYGSWIVGQAAKYYFEHESGWAGQSPKKVVRAIVASTDKGSVVRKLKDEILERLRGNRHASDLDADAARAADAIAERLGDPTGGSFGRS